MLCLCLNCARMALGTPLEHIDNRRCLSAQCRELRNRLAEQEWQMQPLGIYKGTLVVKLTRTFTAKAGVVH